MAEETEHHIPKKTKAVGRDVTSLTMGHIGLGGRETHVVNEDGDKSRKVSREVGEEPGSKNTGSGVCDMSCSEKGPRSHGNDTDDNILLSEGGSGRTIKPVEGKEPTDCFSSEK